MSRSTKPFTTVWVSPSSRRAWIEITLCFAMTAPKIVALLAEGVDRNRSGWRGCPG